MNRILAAHDALDALLATLFPTALRFRNPEGQAHLKADDTVVVLADDEAAETLNVMSGAVYDLKVTPTVTLARRATEGVRRGDIWADVDALRLALDADPTLGGVVEDARLDAAEPAGLERARWMAGGLDVSVRLLFAAPSPAG